MGDTQEVTVVQHWSPQG